MTTQMNDKIADRLDGMRTTDHRICKGRKEPYLRVYDERHQRYISFYPHDLLAFCRAVVERCDGKNKKLQKIFNALDNHLGDTDPDILEDATDDEIRDEEPVFWAANEIAKILKENK